MLFVRQDEIPRKSTREGRLINRRSLIKDGKFDKGWANATNWVCQNTKTTLILLANQRVPVTSPCT